jgi:predicted transcriptional regulator
VAKINENKLAKSVTDLEGGIENLTVAQVKEVMKATFEILANEFKMSEVVALLESHKY